MSERENRLEEVLWETLIFLTTKVVIAYRYQTEEEYKQLLNLIEKINGAVAGQGVTGEGNHE